MNDIEFRPCYRCGGKVTEDFLGRIRCTKCGYDLRTMSIDPDFEPEEEVCKYCDLIPSMDGMISFGENLPLEDDNGHMFVFQDEECHYGLCYHDYEDDEHMVGIKYCPMCGRKLIESETE